MLWQSPERRDRAMGAQGRRGVARERAVKEVISAAKRPVQRDHPPTTRERQPSINTRGA
jgi:hypothetical protein